MKKHLAIFTKEAVEQIFKGEKTIETRFSLKKIPPYNSVSKGDLVYIKLSGKEIVGQFLVKKVIFFDGLDQTDWQLIQKNYGEKISFGKLELDRKYFKNKKDALLGSLIFIESVEQFITSPIKVSKSDRRGWMVLDNNK